MENEKVYAMSFGKVYTALVNKALRKNRTQDEVNEVIGWLTGYSPDSLKGFADSALTYGDFFRNAPAMNPKRRLITGSICGVRVENIHEPLMQDIRCLDKLIDELAKGRPMEKIYRR